MGDRSEALDAVRGIAIAMVVGYHYWQEVLPNGSLGVDLFFVLSGYLIGGMLLDHQGVPGFFTIFYWRRAFRILPLYWTLLLICLPAAGLPTWWFLAFGQNWGWLFRDEFRPSVLSVTWSLAFEEQFYLLLPAMIAFLPRRWLVRLLWGCVISAPCWRYLVAYDDPFVARLVLPCRLDALMGGALLACFERGYAQSRMLWGSLAAVAPGLDLAFHRFDPSYHLLLYSVSALIFVSVLWLITQLPAARFTIARPLTWLGVGAYSIYLFHVLLADLIGDVTLALVATLALAWVSWRYVESPLIRFARARWRYGPAPIAIPAE